jgi:hypothetical protein
MRSRCGHGNNRNHHHNLNSSFLQRSSRPPVSAHVCARTHDTHIVALNTSDQQALGKNDPMAQQMPAYTASMQNVRDEYMRRTSGSIGQQEHVRICSYVYNILSVWMYSC